jgi:hypothetical protein
MADDLIMFKILVGTFAALLGILIALRVNYRNPRPSKEFVHLRTNIDWIGTKLKK